MNQMQGGGSRVMSFGKSRAKRMSVDAPKITFRDVAGVDEAVQELHEIKEFLENPKKFQSLGARIPKGVLLYGPPGTGKTLLARAVAGEAGVPFFSISGSDFVEMFVGVGASRVRDLFEQAKQNSPCIIFMDEIDAVGRHRGAGMGGGHDEREQTLNQLLVEMDGFEMNDNIILIAATNRPDILDPALLRPGRFDRQIVVDRPDRQGRKKILEVHTRGKPLAKEIDLDALAGQTPGFTGADLANLINEAALLTARSGKREITMNELEEGIMRVIAGPEKKTRVMSEKERLVTAYHEMGHAIVGHLLPNCDPVHKISIISRGQALGYTISLPDRGQVPDHPRRAHRHDGDDARRPRRRGDRLRRDHHRRLQRPREGDRDGEADGDALRDVRAPRPARLRPRPLEPFLGREFSSEPDYSDEIAREIDDEIRRIVEEAHQTAKDILTEHRDELDRISEDPARARDDRRRAVREAARGRLRGGGLRRPRTPSPSRRGRARARARAARAARARARCRSRAPASPAAPPRCAPTTPPERDRRRLPDPEKLASRPPGACRLAAVPITTQYRKDSDDEASRGDSWLPRLARSRGRRSSVPRASPAWRWPTTSTAALPPTQPSSWPRRSASRPAVARTTSSVACTGSAATRRSARSSSPGARQGVGFACSRQVVIKLDHFTGDITYATSRRRCVTSGSRTAKGRCLEGRATARPSSFRVRAILRA